MNLFRTRPETENYWVVRANSGLYFDHFMQFGVIAISHLDEVRITSDETTPFEANLKDVEGKLKAKAIEEKKTTNITMTVNQIKYFMEDMSVGDWVITVGADEIAIGRIVGHPRYETKSLDLWDGDRKKSLEYRLRRKVSWGPRIKKENAPDGLRRSLRANQTVFNIKEHWSAIYHTLYPHFYNRDKLHFSLEIAQRGKINPFYISELLGTVSEFEVLAKTFEANADVSDYIENFKENFYEFIDNDALSIRAQMKVMSPGEVWGTVDLALKNNQASVFLVALSAMLGKELPKHIIGSFGDCAQVIKAILETRNANRMIRHLQAREPHYDTKPLEDTSKDEGPFN